MTPNQFCQNCKFWNNRQQVRPQFTAPNVTVTVPPGGGYCTFNAPVLSIGGLPWPVTTPQSSCGQWMSNQTVATS